MSYEVFTKRIHRYPYTTSPFATIYHGKCPRIGFSLPCIQWFMARDVEAVEYLWDKSTKTMAFRPTRSPNGYAVLIKSSQAYVFARLFLEHIGNPSPGRYEAKLTDDFIEVQLGTPQGGQEGKRE